MSTDELSRAVAEIVGGDGFEVGACPQGHPHGHFDQIGNVCFVCASEAARAAAGTEPNLSARRHYHAWLEKMVQLRKAIIADPAAHPEWHIGRGEPKPYAKSLDLLVPVVDAWCERTRNVFRLLYIDGGDWQSGIGGPFDGESPIRPWIGYGSKTAAEALALSFLAAVSRWGT